MRVVPGRVRIVARGACDGTEGNNATAYAGADGAKVGGGCWRVAVWADARTDKEAVGMRLKGGDGCGKGAFTGD